MRFATSTVPELRLDRSAQVAVVTELPAEPSVLLDTKVAAYPIAQEALHNVVKHAHASHAWLRVGVDESALTVEVKDDGDGFEVLASSPGHFGLETIRERVSAAHGQLRVESKPGCGTAVLARLPMVSGAGQPSAAGEAL